MIRIVIKPSKEILLGFSPLPSWRTTPCYTQSGAWAPSVADSSSLLPLSFPPSFLKTINYKNPFLPYSTTTNLPTYWQLPASGGSLICRCDVGLCNLTRLWIVFISTWKENSVGYVHYREKRCFGLSNVHPSSWWCTYLIHMWYMCSSEGIVLVKNTWCPIKFVSEICSLSQKPLLWITWREISI